MSLPRYPNYVESGIDWLGEVPAHWKVIRARYAVALNPSKGEVAHVPEQQRVTFVPMEGIGDDGSLDTSRTRPLGELRTGYTYFREDDVVVAKITPCFENGKRAIMRGLSGGFGFGTTELIVARPIKERITTDFLGRITSSTAFRALGEAEMYGAGGQKRVPDDFVRDFRVALPDLHEQDLICRFLDRETAKIDALVEEQERLIALLKEKRQAVISHAVTKGLDPSVPMKDSGVEWLGEVPGHWEVRKLSSITDKITNGYVGPTRDILVDEGVRYLQSLHIKRNKIKFDQPYYVTEEWSQEHKKSVLHEGDVLIVQTGDIGQVAVVPKEFEDCNCHALIVTSPIRSILGGDWLSWVLCSNYGLHTLLSIQTGALHPHLNCGNVKDIFIPVPPLDEQKSTISKLTRETGSIDHLVEEAGRGVALLRERRSALISAAVTGQIDVRGLVDEEAAA